jgi:hypothetical protein
MDMNPYPFSALNHFTVPVFMKQIPPETKKIGRPKGRGNAGHYSTVPKFCQINYFQAGNYLAK